MIRFDRQVAIVTGAGTGLGRSYARLLASRGARVIVNDPGGSVGGSGGSRSVADAVVAEIKSEGGEAVANYDSVAEPAQAQNIIDSAIGAFGRLDILINNAGILRDAPFEQSSLEDLRLLVDVHLLGTLYCTRAALKIMRQQDYGRIVLTSSGSGLVGYAGQSIYGAAKAGMLGLMNCVALECRETGIGINTVLPSAATRMSQGLVAENIARHMKPELVAPLVVWLSSRECKSNGDCIAAFGGHFAKVQVFKASGVQFDPVEEVSPEMIADRCDEILSMTEAEPFAGTRTVLADAYKALDRL